MTRFVPFSPKQRTALNWWVPGSPYASRDGIICDGAVRSGKTLCCALSFITWATANYDGMTFALCGKTVGSVRRNIISAVMPALREAGFACREKISAATLEVSAWGHKNTFRLFGGRDESSAALIQGITLAGVLLDEAALMPRSFVEQALARCSVKGAKFWFNCNPGHPMHWFHTEWIEKADEKNCLYLHFTMDDNPSLSPEIRQRYERLYTGVFRERYVLGLWTAADGAVYPSFSPDIHVKVPPEDLENWCISCDYGTVNPCSFGLWGQKDGVWYRVAEYYWDSEKEGRRKTDSEHCLALEALAGNLPVTAVTVDPSAASFIETVKRRGVFTVIPAKNDVPDGIRRVQDYLASGRLFISPACKNTIREFGLYRWDSKAPGDRVIKENDHAMDDIRYFVSTLAGLDPQGGFFALSVSRR
ncbi:MAG: PBSX family phage terminase large subunit [Clostridia bacterium]|nr:PBSX family phage terminase large subunit [Clostridia bacterium]